MQENLDFLFNFERDQFSKYVRCRWYSLSKIEFFTYILMSQSYFFHKTNLRGFFITSRLEVAIIIRLLKSSIIITCAHHFAHKHSEKSQRCPRRVGFIKLYMGYFILETPTSEGSVLTL